MKEVIGFLKEIRANNNREWLEANKKQFETAKNQMKGFAQELSGLMTAHDNVDPKPKLFRIYRDVRFSKDKTPFKTSMSGSFTRLTPALRGGYYFHVEPGASFLGGGFWQPEKDDLMLIRQQIQQDAEPLREVINSKQFKAYFGELGGEQLKTKPKGFEADDPNIDLLRYKSFIVSKSFTDKEVLAPDFCENVNEGFRNMRPFFNVMSEYLTTNLNGELIV